jgi:23S rRNA (adenine2030-N6)-methyltransferase
MYRYSADMLAYRHAFHAGNHADVLKHLVLVGVLRRMAVKPKPYTLIDTHAGAGRYALEGRHAQQKAEYRSGIGRLWGRGDLPQPLAEYLAVVRDFNADGRLRLYPGSPAIASTLLRPTDALRLFELHPTDFRILRSFIGRRPHTKVAIGDGFAALKGELPPPSRRGVVLIDPSYELKGDYAKTLAAVRETLARFAQAVVVVWIPQVQLVEAAQLPRRVQAAADSAAPRGWLRALLTVRQADTQGFGLTGSHVVVINPPHGLREDMHACLPFLVDVLGQYAGASFVLEHRLP